MKIREINIVKRKKEFVKQIFQAIKNQYLIIFPFKKSCKHRKSDRKSRTKRFCCDTFASFNTKKLQL